MLINAGKLGALSPLLYVGARDWHRLDAWYRGKVSQRVVLDARRGRDSSSRGLGELGLSFAEI